MAGVSVRVAFQGELGAYSEEAVRRYWPGEGTEPVPKRSCADVVRALEDGEVDYGMLPIENSLAGNVVATYDALSAARGCWVVGETIVPIHHCLLALAGTDVASITRVASHPVALAQCGRFLERHPHMEADAAYDTAGAARDQA
jgi:prephenate dehydratase